MEKRNKLILVSGVNTPDFSRINNLSIDKVYLPKKLSLVFKHLMLIFGIILTEYFISKGLEGVSILGALGCFTAYKLVEYNNSINTKDSFKNIKRLGKSIIEANLLGVSLGVVFALGSFESVCVGLLIFIIIRYKSGVVHLLSVIEDMVLLMLPLLFILLSINGLKGSILSKEGLVSQLLITLIVIICTLGFIFTGILRDRLVFGIKLKYNKIRYLSIGSHTLGVILWGYVLSQWLEGDMSYFVAFEGLVLIMAGIFLSERRGYITLRHIL